MKKLQKIALLTEEYHTEKYFSGGIGQAFAKLSYWFAENGFRVIVYIPSYRDVAYNEKDNIIIKKLRPPDKKTYSVFNYCLKKFRLNRFVDKIKRYNKEMHLFDVLNKDYKDGEFDILLNNRGALVKNFLQKKTFPVIIRLQNPWPELLKQEFRTVSQESIVEHKKLVASLKYADALYAPSRVAAEYFAREIQRNVPVIKTPMFDMGYKEPVENTKLQKPFLLFFGGLLGRKGAHILAEALHVVFKENDSINAVFVAGRITNSPITGMKMDEYIQKTLSEHPNRFQILGPLQKPELNRIIMDSDFVVLPSIMDNLPNTVLEAMFLKKVVIGTKGEKSSIDEIIEDGRDGFLAEAGDRASLIKTIQKVLLLSEKEKEMIGNNACKKVTDACNPDLVMRSLVKLMDDVLCNLES